MVLSKRGRPDRGALKRDMRDAFGEMRSAFGAMMRAQLAQRRHAFNAKIKAIEGMLRGIDVAISRPGSKAALRSLTAIRDQLGEHLRAETAGLNKLVASNKRLMVKMRRGLGGPFVSADAN